MTWRGTSARVQMDGADAHSLMRRHGHRHHQQIRKSATELQDFHGSWNFFASGVYRVMSYDIRRVVQAMDEDVKSIKQMLSGDREAFRSLIGRHQSAVCATIAALCPRGADEEDLAQEVFLAAFRHLASFDAAKGSFRTWILAITRNQCRTAHRRRVVPQLDPLPERLDERTPECLASEAECFERLDAGLAALPEEQRLVFVLVEMQGCTYQEAAEIAEVQVGTVKSRLSRAREWLREKLRPMIIEEERATASPRHGTQ